MESLKVKEEKKQSDLWVATLAVDGELTRVEALLAAEQSKQAELTKQYLAQKVYTLKSNLIWKIVHSSLNHIWGIYGN
eukprot:1187194-Prorocentrum_minimum.AAC.3